MWFDEYVNLNDWWCVKWEMLFMLCMWFRGDVQTY